MRDPMEKLAREICWLGFALPNPKHVGCTKAQYWKNLPESTRQNYRADARQFAYLLDRLDVDLLNELPGGHSEPAISPHTVKRSKHDNRGVDQE